MEFMPVCIAAKLATKYTALENNVVCTFTTTNFTRFRCYEKWSLLPCYTQYCNPENENKFVTVILFQFQLAVIKIRLDD